MRPLILNQPLTHIRLIVLDMLSIGTSTFVWLKNTVATYVKYDYETTRVKERNRGLSLRAKVNRL